jgi:CheY-like chemotaxis protein
MTPMHVLVLERDPERRDAVLGMLRAAGHQAAAAPDGPAAAAAIGVPGFDSLLLDLGMPDLDLARLRESVAPAVPVAPEPLEAAERRHIALMLRHTGGNKRQAAHLLGISRSTLLHKVRKYGLAAGALALVLFASAAAAQAAAIPAGRVSVGTLSFDVTGNAHRDRDLNKSMETGKFPTMRFDLHGVTAVCPRCSACSKWTSTSMSTWT